MIDKNEKKQRVSEDNTESSSQQGDYYFENGLMVMTESYLMKRGYCCGSKCRHCPYEHINVTR